MQTREVIVSTSTAHPNSAWVKRQTEAFIEQTWRRLDPFLLQNVSDRLPADAFDAQFAHL
jgi:hypothetical protein